MPNLQARMKHRTTVQIAELCLQSAEDCHQQYLYSATCHKPGPRSGRYDAEAWFEPSGEPGKAAGKHMSSGVPE